MSAKEGSRDLEAIAKLSPSSPWIDAPELTENCAQALLGVLGRQLADASPGPNVVLYIPQRPSHVSALFTITLYQLSTKDVDSCPISPDINSSCSIHDPIP